MKKHLLTFLLTLTFAINCKSQAVVSYPLPTGTHFPRNVLKIDALGNKWVGFHRIGLGKFNSGVWTTYDSLTSNIPSNQVNDIAFDASNNVWVATIKGVSKFDGSIWTTYNVINSGLPDDSVSCVYVNNTDIWIGTRNGLAKFDGTTWNIYNTTTTSLTSNLIQCVSVESTGDVWVGTKTGLFKKSGSTWSNYNSTNPYLVNTYNVEIIYIDSSNDKWFAIKGTLGNCIYKLVSNSLAPITTLFPEYNFSSTISTIHSISTGPNGGLAFCYGTPYLFELAGNQLYRYNLVGGNHNIFDSSTGLVWYLNYSGGSSLFSFNPTLYAGTPLVNPNFVAGYNTLDINMVNAGLLNRGDMHWDLNKPRYEVPKGSGRNGMFCSAFWIGGLDASENLHLAATRYRSTGIDYRPGPLDTINGTVDSITSFNYDKIWKVSREKINEFKYMFAVGLVTSGTYIVDENIITWPAAGTGNYSRNLAPFIDVNGDGLYNPLIDGDYPDIKGDQMCFWIFNDNLPHTETGGTELKVEVHASAYAYVCSTIADSMKAINYTTFYNYKIFNRSSENYHKTYLGIFQENQVGSPNDDYIGCTPPTNYAFAYNGDTIDSNPPQGIAPYGIKPPMISTVILNGPLAESNDSIDNNNNGITDEVGEKNLMSHFIDSKNDPTGVHGHPNLAIDFYNFMSGRWCDSSQITYGGEGSGGSIPYDFIFDGVPGDTLGWSENPSILPPFDRRVVIGCGPFNLNAGENVEFDYAVVYTRDTASTYTIQNLYQKNKEDVMRIQHWFAIDSFPSCAFTVGINNISQIENTLSIYPNPTNENITINFISSSKNTSVKIYDTTGRIVKNIENVRSGENTINISELEAGLYILNLQDDNNSVTKRFIKQ